jgi:hypothetical protein
MGSEQDRVWTGNPFAQHTYRDRGSWKKTLHAKAEFFEAHTEERHNILGSFPSSVRLLPPKSYAGSQEGAWQQVIETGELPPGWTFDHGTTGSSNVAHTSSWTGCLLTSQAFRVAFLRSSVGEDNEAFKVAYARAAEVIHSLRILTLVTGQPGYLARGVAFGHGISYEEREGAGTRDLWAQGVGEYSHLRYRGGPSHHNYNQVLRGLGIYYVVAADEAQKEQVREIVADMSNWAHLKHDMVVKHLDGERISTELIGGWRETAGTDRPSGSSLMAIAGLKVASHITGNEAVTQLHDKWVEKLGFRDPARNQENIMGPSRGNYDDSDHLMGNLYFLHQVEEDEALRAYYTKCVKDGRAAHKSEKMAWLNFVYGAVLGEDYGDLEGSVWNLQTHPTCRILQPQMNSLRTDIEFHEGDRGLESLNPLPVNERSSDNEYEWKGSPYRLDGWLSRTVSLLEVSPHDPYVQIAADASGNAYWSNTQGETWHGIDGLAGVRDILFSLDYPWIVFAATDVGVSRTLDGGMHWEPVFDEQVEGLRFSSLNNHVVYAVGKKGVYRSEDLGERDMGTVWQCVSNGAPVGSVFAVDSSGENAIVYALSRRGVFKQAEGEKAWKAIPQVSRRRGFGTVDSVGGDPVWLRVDECGKGRLFRAVQTERGPLVSVSEDAGESWCPVVRELGALTNWALGAPDSNVNRDELARLMGVKEAFPLRDLQVHSSDPDVWFGLMGTQVAVTNDAGQSWEVSQKGLDIPQVHAIWTPRHAALAMAGTPAGMYVSGDKGKNWTDTSLVLQEAGAIRAEIGGIGYLTAYWMGRHHDFISEEEANREWWVD